MEDFETFMKIRMKWCDSLEWNLECPICLEVLPNKNIFICKNGHDTCETCLQQKNFCQSCNASTGSIRNKGTEQMLKKLDDIKESLLDFKQKKVEMKNIAIQTELASEFNIDRDGKNQTTQTE